MTHYYINAESIRERWIPILEEDQDDHATIHIYSMKPSTLDEAFWKRLIKYHEHHSNIFEFHQYPSGYMILDMMIVSDVSIHAYQQRFMKHIILTDSSQVDVTIQHIQSILPDARIECIRLSY